MGPWPRGQPEEIAMSSRHNPLNLNQLQRKTLTLLQELAKYPETSTRHDETGEVLITYLPAQHGDHFHIGGAIVRATDASGLRNESVWKALERKGLARASFPIAIVLTAQGLAYDTGLRDVILVSTARPE